jgi:uncharacterized membrane protein YgdD (TMEM256/DUF423 family)
MVRQSENRATTAFAPAPRHETGRPWIAAAAAAGAFAVAVGAFAAHGLDPVARAQAIGWLHTGSQYQGMHALAMLAVVALSDRLSRRWARIALWSFLAGLILFPAALYGLALDGPRWLGAIAPVGGLGFIFGWTALAMAGLKRNDE